MFYTQYTFSDGDREEFESDTVEGLAQQLAKRFHNVASFGLTWAYPYKREELTEAELKEFNSAYETALVPLREKQKILNKMSQELSDLNALVLKKRIQISELDRS